MDVALQVLTYLSGVVFVAAFAAKIRKYTSMPMHVRWELYPVPHEGKAWGGSYFEEADYWKKTRHKDYLAQYKFMVPEILFIRALYEDNRPLWNWSFPLHAGLYLCIGGLLLLIIGAFLQILGLRPGDSAVASLVQSLTVVFAVLGYILGAVGAVGLIIKRMTDPTLKDFTAGIDHLNLAWLGAIFVTGYLVWLMDPVFAVSGAYLVSLIAFKPVPPEMTGLHVINLLLFLGFLVYFPFTHMAHMVTKYFMWDKVKWDNDPNIGDAGMDEKIRSYLAYPVTWSAPHIGAEGGKRTWAEVVTQNPWADEAKK